MKLLAQSVDVANVRRDTLNGQEYLVAPTIAVKPSDNLHGGYVPADELRSSVDAWNGRPLPLGHPTNPRGQLISANDPTVVDNTSVGRFYNAEFNPSDDSIRGEIWVNIQKARSMGGAAERALNKLENGDPLEVSSGYRSVEGEPGHYDGAFRDRVQVNLQPDHVALVPDGTGRCSWEDGCGAPRVNAEPGEDIDPSDSDGTDAAVTVVEDYDDASLTDDLTIHADSDDTDNDSGSDRQFRANVRSSARRPSYSGTSESDWSKPTLDDYVSGLDLGDVGSVDDLSGDQKTTIAEMTLLGEAGADSFDELSFFPVVEPSSRNLNRNALNAVRGGRGSQADIPDDAKNSAQNMAGTLLEEEFDADVQGNANATPDDVDADEARGAFATLATALGFSSNSDSDSDPTNTDDEPNQETNQDPDPDDSDPDDCNCGGQDQDPDPDDDQGQGQGQKTMAANQQEGDRVRWDSDAGISREPDDVRYGIVINLLQDGPEDQVKVAVYAPDSDEGEWTATGSDVNVKKDNLDTIEQFPAISQVAGNSADQNTDNNQKNMNNEYDLPTLVANSAFDADELRDDEDLQNKVADTISITGNADDDGNGDDDGGNGDGNGDDDGTDADDDGDDDDGNGDDGDDGDDDGADDDSDAAADLRAAVESLQETVEEQNQTIAKLKANVEAEEKERREQLKNQIKANSSNYSDDQLDEASDDLLESIAADVAGGFADLTARGAGQAQRANSTDDVDDMSTGTMVDYKERKAGGDD